MDLEDIYQLKTNLIEIKNNIYIEEDINHLKTNFIKKVKENDIEEDINHLNTSLIEKVKENELYILEDGFLAISRNLKNIFVVIDKNEMDEDKIRVLN